MLLQELLLLSLHLRDVIRVVSYLRELLKARAASLVRLDLYGCGLAIVSVGILDID